jgi:hypothetical protein
MVGDIDDVIAKAAASGSCGLRSNLMAEMMQFDLVSPERKLASGQVRAVQIPGADGDLTAMPRSCRDHHHAAPRCSDV